MDIHCFANPVWPDFFVSHHSSLVGITNYGWWKLGVVIRRGFDLQVMWCQDIWPANYKMGPKTSCKWGEVTPVTHLFSAIYKGYNL